MNWWNRLWRKRELEDQLDREMRFHLDQHTADLIAQGLDPAEARRQSRIELGGPELVKEECRDARGTRWLDDFWQDIRYAVRTLRQRPGFTVINVVTLALGIGACTAIFSAVKPILLDPLPYPNASRVISVWDRSQDGTRSFATFGSYRELVQRSQFLQTAAVMRPWRPAMTGEGQPERLDGQYVSAEFFKTLGVEPQQGRDFRPSDDLPRGPKVVILSHGLWQHRFHGDKSIVGSVIRLDDDLYTVIGIMPRGFENVLAPGADVWSTLQYDPSAPLNGREWGHHLEMIARLRPGLLAEKARDELNAIARAKTRDFPRAPWATLKNGLLVNSLQDDVTRAVKPALLAVFGAVLLVLTIACVNVMNLLLARSAQRRGEFAMRAALGARRARLIRQLLTESLVLALAGGGLAILVAEYGIRALVAFSPAELPRAGAIGIDASIFTIALGITTLIGLAIGLVPALHASREDLQVAMRQNSRSATGSRQWMRRSLVVAEISLALVLLTGSGLLLRSLQRLFSISPGFDASHLLTMQVQTASHRLDRSDAKYRFFADALEAVRRVPGVTMAGITSQLPLGGDQFGAYGVRFESSTSNDESQFRYAVSPGYLETMAIALRQGRLLDARDKAGAPVVVLINESLAKRKFPAGDAIGRRVHVGPDSFPWATIVGVVGDVKQTSLAVGLEDAFYMTAQQGWFADDVMSLAVRARGDVTALIPAIKEAIWSVDKDQPIGRIATMDDLVARSAAERRFALVIFEGFALVALLLAATGIYGVLSGGVTERVREIGVRSALGATRGNIVALVVRQAMTLTGLGVIIGLMGAAAASQALISLLFGVSRFDPVTYTGVPVLLVGVAAIACFVPAWRAARIDPANALRME